MKLLGVLHVRGALQQLPGEVDPPLVHIDRYCAKKARAEGPDEAAGSSELFDDLECLAPLPGFGHKHRVARQDPALVATVAHAPGELESRDQQLPCL